MKRYYSIKSIDEVTDDERDLTLYEDLFPGWEHDDFDNGPDCILDESSNEGTPIPVDVLIMHLQGLKNAGANYISMYHHEDHHGYEIEGLNIYRSTPEEIEVYEDKQDKKKKRDKEILEAEKKLNELKKKPL